ncbi:TIGR03826 family flagellar region protein [Alkalihalobacterium elongatum]|uniref:TIGR03826 family flagellar region protein n=1 Tax=Alkalihalobacterium elongatum TaxID=2675466 RepID=UPI001C1F79F8|nr:TIGR03826 family flagellar region protein [Alkalihalobacterium elongatum]
MPSLENCPRCGGLFVKALRTICDKCHREIDAMFQTVYTFIRKRDNRKATLQEVVAATGVKEEYIFQFIREGRLQLAHYPNLAYPCDMCGAMIREGKICPSCRTSMNKDIENYKAQEGVAERNRLREKATTQTTYHLFDDEVKRK